jgi:hypothetical protein
MKRNALVGALALVAALLVGSSRAAQLTAEGGLERAEPVSAAAAREFELRALAVDPQAARAALASELASADAARRVLALEALRRALCAGSARELDWIEAAARAAVDDPDANARERALRVLALLPHPQILPQRRALELAGEALPALREALALAIGRSQAAEELERAPAWTLALLERLAQDADAATARAARTALCAESARDARTHASLAALIALELQAERVSALLELARAWRAVGGAPAVLEAWDQAVANRADAAVWRSVLAALEAEAQVAREPAQIARRWIAGWRLEALPELDRVALRNLRHASAMRASAEVGAAVLRELARLGGAPSAAEGGPASEPAASNETVVPVAPTAAAAPTTSVGPRGGLDDASLRELVGLSVHTLGSARASALALEWSADEPLALLVLRELGSRAQGFELEQERAWLAPERARALRAAAIEAFASCALHEADEGAAQLLALALADPDAQLRERAFRGLGHAAERAPHAAAMLAAWNAESVDTRLAWLRELPKAGELSNFCARALELAQQLEPARREALLELLEGCAGDERAAQLLAQWLEEALVPGAERLAAAAGWMRALTRIAPTHARGPAEGALARAAHFEALAASSGEPNAQAGARELGKAAVLALAQDAAGRSQLAHFLQQQPPARLAIEAAIQLARAAQGAQPPSSAELELALARLAGDLLERRASFELELRMLEALALSGVSSAQLELARVLRTADLSTELRAQALEHYAASAGPVAAAAELGDLLTGSQPIELRLAAVRALGRLALADAQQAGEAGAFAPAEASAVDARAAGAQAAAARLAECWRALRAQQREPDLEGERALLLEALLPVLAACGAEQQDLHATWLAAATARAARDYDARALGEALPQVGFAWRGELECAQQLAARAQLRAALAGWSWERLDARLLAALAQRSQRGASARGAAEPDALAAELARAALIGLEGEREPDAALASTLRAALILAAQASEQPVALELLESVERGERARQSVAER